MAAGFDPAVNWRWLRNGKARWLLPALVLIGATVAVFLVWPRKDELARWKAEMLARGEKLALSELAPPFRAECLAHEARFSNAVQQGNFSRMRPGAIALMSKTQNGYARVVAPQAEPIEKGAAMSWDELAEQMATNAGTLREIRGLIASWPEGSARDHRAGVNVGILPLLQKRSAAHALVNAFLNDLHRQAPAAALANLQALLGLARLHERECLLVDQMVRVAITGLAVTAAWEALQAPGWDDAALAALQADLERTALLPNLPRTAAMEQAFGISAYELARTNGRGPRALVGSIGIPGNGKIATMFNDAVYRPLWQKAWSRRDELIYLKAMRSVGEAVRDAQTNRSYQALRGLLAARRAEMDAHQGVLDRFRYQVAEAAQANWDRACLTLMRTETLRQMSITAAALKRHRLRYGKLPEDLRSLVPEFLAGLKTDYMDGKPLRYQRDPDGGFTLHSVGENGRDEQGQGDDVLWPKPEPVP